MNITLEELRGLLSAPTQPQPTTCCTADGVNLGQCICVLDRGFVYVGNVEERSDRIIITDAKNIRKWGTTKGLGELTSGPLKDTVLDPVGSVIVYRKSVIHVIPCKCF